MENVFYVFPNNNYIDLGMYQVGYEKCSAGHSFGPAARNHFIFHYVLSGRGVLHDEDASGNEKLYKVEAGEGFMLWPGHITTYIADARFPWTYMWIEFDGLRVQEALQIAGFSKYNPIYKSSKENCRKRLEEEMLYIIENKEGSQLELIGHLYLFLDYLTRSLTNKPIQAKNRLRNFYVHEALSYIEEHYGENISIEEISSNCGLNRSYLGKIFKEEIGSTPQHFLLNYRMVKSTELLRSTDKSIAEIAASVGYDNQLHFSRAFKGIYGMPPRQWRSENSVQS